MRILFLRPLSLLITKKDHTKTKLLSTIILVKCYVMIQISTWRIGYHARYLQISCFKLKMVNQSAV